MGRARITLRHISNERSRKTTFMRRKRGLMKKISEFSKKCGGEHCLIVYDDGNGDVGPVTSPQNLVEVHSIIQKYYEIQLKKETSHKTYGIEEFFENRKNMIEAEICKVNKQISSIKYPTWNPSIIDMEEDQLRAFCAHVDAKIEACDQGIKLLKNKAQSKANASFMQNMNLASAPFSHPNLPNLMQSLSHGQIIPTPIQRVDFTNSINQVDEASNHEISYMLRNMQQGGGDDACFGFVPNMAQENATATTSHPSQVNCLQSISQSQPLLEDFSNPVDVPLNSTNQLCDLEFEELFMELTGCDWSYQPCHDPVGCTSQPDESLLPTISAEYQYKQQEGGALHALPPPLHGFQTNYYNMLF